MDLQLTHKVAIVTGSSKGLGFASAKALVAEGCRVCICARGADALDQAAAELRRLASTLDDGRPTVDDRRSTIEFLLWLRTWRPGTARQRSSTPP
jgi:3-oxoacyl-[acyl-carrier protein] reductase